MKERTLIIPYEISCHEIPGVTVSKNLPSEYPFSFPVRVRFADTDLQGQVFWGHYFTCCDEGFMAYLKEIGYSWEKLGTMGLELYYVESYCQFKGRAFFADTLNVNPGIAELGRSARALR